MIIKPFSFQRLVLYITCIIVAALFFKVKITFVESIYFKEDDPLFISLSLFLFYGGIYLLLKFIGIPQRVAEREFAQFKQDVKKHYANEIEQLSRKLSYSDAASTNEKDDESAILVKKIEEAKSTWRNKSKAEMSPFEELHYLNHRIRVISKRDDLLTSLMLLYYAAIFNTSYMFNLIILMTIFSVLFIQVLAKQRLMNRHKVIMNEVFPKDTRDLFESFKSDIP